MKSKKIFLGAMLLVCLVGFGCEKETIEPSGASSFIKMGTITEGMDIIPITEWHQSGASNYFFDIPYFDGDPFGMVLYVNRTISLKPRSSQRRFYSNLFVGDDRIEVSYDSMLCRRALCMTTSPDGISWKQSRWFDYDSGETCDGDLYMQPFKYDSPELLVSRQI
jgi:hypothetical protein